MSSFEVYTSPRVDTPFSTSFFKTLDFNAAIALKYPAIAPQGALYTFAFDEGVPDSPSSSSISPDEIVPCLVDVRPIIEQLEHAYTQGSRAVVVQLRVDGRQKTVVYHFSKVCTLTRVICRTT